MMWKLEVAVLSGMEIVVEIVVEVCCLLLGTKVSRKVIVSMLLILAILVDLAQLIRSLVIGMLTTKMVLLRFSKGELNQFSFEIMTDSSEYESMFSLTTTQENQLLVMGP